MLNVECSFAWDGRQGRLFCKWPGEISEGYQAPEQPNRDCQVEQVSNGGTNGATVFSATNDDSKIGIN